jgi:hypothetical protein
MYEHVKTGCKHISPSEQPLQFQSGYCLNTPHIHGWCSVAFMKLNNSNTVVILSLGIHMFFNYTYKKNGPSCNPYVHCQRPWGSNWLKTAFSHTWSLYFLPHYVRMFGLIQTITSSFSTVVNLLIFYVTLVGPKLEYTSLYGILYCLLTPNT